MSVPFVEVPLSRVVSLQRGHDLTWQQRRPGKVPVVGSAGPNGFHDRAIVPGPGVVLGRSGASFGRAHYVNEDFWPHNTALFATDFHGNDPRYVYFLLDNIDFESYNSGGAQQSLNRNFIASIPVRMPHHDEQRRIAGALDDAGALVVALRQTITKKEAIKQGMMQQLLTGETRLPGFTDPWSEVTAADIGSFKGGNGFPVRYQGKAAGQYPFFKVSDMSNEGNELFMRTANNYVSDSQRKQIGAVVVPANAIVFAKVGAAVFLERKRILTVPSCIDNNLAAFKLDGTLADVRFVYYMLSNFRMGSLVATGALPSLNGRQLRSIPVLLPPSLGEQRAIAEVLDYADAEIGALHLRLTKALHVKQGMMQELLSGRSRLKNEVAA